MPPEDRRFAFLARVTTVAAILAAAIGGLALLGWIFGVYGLAELVPDTLRMTANAAICALLLSGSLWLVRERRRSDEARAWSRFLAELVVLIAGLTLAEYAFNVDLGIDGLFTDDSATAHPGRMSPHSAAALLALGVWLIVLDRTGPRWAPLLVGVPVVAGLIVLAAVIAFIYGADYVYGDTEDASGLAPQTAVASALLFIGILASRPRSVWMRLALSPGSGGTTVRRLIPALIVIPIASGYLLILAVDEDIASLHLAAALQIAGLITVLLAIAIQNSRELEHADVERRGLQARLVELADRDPLTDVFNRRRLDEEVRRQLALAQRNSARLTVLSIDLDDFKAVNDTYGHATGDELLIATAEVLRDELRASDFACRPGGDEFIILLPDTDDPAARIVAGKLVRSFRGVQRPKPGGGVIRLHASIGIAISDEGGWIEPDELLAAADRALYAAKQAGGDRFAVEETLVLD